MIIVGNNYFDALWYGEPLFWIPMLIGGLGPAFGSYIMYRKYNKEFGRKSFFKFIFGKKIDRQALLLVGLYLFLGIVLSFTFTTIYKYTKNLLLCVLSHAWFNGCIGLAVYIGSAGYLQLNLTWKVFLVFILELIVSVILGKVYNRKNSIKNNRKNILS